MPHFSQFWRVVFKVWCTVWPLLCDQSCYLQVLMTSKFSLWKFINFQHVQLHLPSSVLMIIPTLHLLCQVPEEVSKLKKTVSSHSSGVKIDGHSWQSLQYSIKNVQTFNLHFLYCPNIVISSVLFNLSCIWILFQNASSHSCFRFVLSIFTSCSPSQHAMPFAL